MQALVTKDSLKKMLDDADEVLLQHIIGRALLVLFKNQTQTEQVLNQTEEDNGIGFTGADARGGSLCAKSYLRKKRLEDWQVKRWMKLGSNGYPRICKYHKQLNDAAINKAIAKSAKAYSIAKNGIDSPSYAKSNAMAPQVQQSLL